MTKKTGLVKILRKHIDTLDGEFTFKDVASDVVGTNNQISRLLHYLHKTGYVRITNKIQGKNIYVKVETQDKVEAEPELNYEQIGKAIIERIKRLDSLANSSLATNSELKTLEFEVKQTRAHNKELQDTISKLNKRIYSLNEQLQQSKERERTTTSSSTKTFKLGDIARIS